MLCICVYVCASVRVLESGARGCGFWWMLGISRTLYAYICDIIKRIHLLTGMARITGGKEEAVGCRPYSSVGGWRTMIYGGGVERYLWVKIEHSRSPANVQPKLVRVTCFRRKRTVGREGGGWRLGSSFYSESYVHTGLSKAHARRTHTQRQLHVVKVYYSRYSALILCCALLLLLLVGSLNGDVCT